MLNFARKIFHTDSSEALSKKTAKGSLWLLIFRVFDQVFRLVRTIVLARLLAPSDFGLFGVTLMVISFFDTFSQSGFQQALVHKKEDIKPYLDTSFVVQVLRAFLLASIVFISAPFIALFFSAPAVEPVLKVISLAILIQGFTNIAVVYFSKELEFQKHFIYQISGTVADFAISLSLALIFRNVWALVAGYLGGAIVRCVISYVVSFYLPRLSFNFKQANELFGYGRWIFGNNIVGFFVSQIDSFFVAKISGIASLGFYQMAYRIPSILGLEILAGATFPAYAKIQDDKQKLKEVYLKITKLFCLILMPMAAGIFVVSADFIKLFLGANWLPCVFAMRFLSLSVLAWTMAVISDYLFLAVGRPNIQAKWTSVKLLILFILLYPLITKYSFTGASVAVLLGSVIAAAGLVFEAMKILKCSLWQYTENIIFSFINAFIMAVVILFLKNYLPSNIWSFLFVILFGVLVYYLLTLVSDKIFNNKAIQLLKESLRLLA